MVEGVLVYLGKKQSLPVRTSRTSPMMMPMKDGEVRLRVQMRDESNTRTECRLASREVACRLIAYVYE